MTTPDILILASAISVAAMVALATYSAHGAHHLDFDGAHGEKFFVTVRADRRARRVEIIGFEVFTQGVRNKALESHSSIHNEVKAHVAAWKSGVLGW